MDVPGCPGERNGQRLVRDGHGGDGDGGRAGRGAREVEPSGVSREGVVELVRGYVGGLGRDRVELLPGGGCGGGNDRVKDILVGTAADDPGEGRAHGEAPALGEPGVRVDPGLEAGGVVTQHDRDADVPGDDLVEGDLDVE